MLTTTTLCGFMAFTLESGITARQNYYAESNSRSTTTSTSFQDKTTLTFTPDDNSDYYIFWTASLDCSITTSDVNAKLINTTTSTDLSVVNIEPQDTLNRHNVGGVVRQQFTTGHGSQTYKIQYDVEAASTAGIADARIWAVKASSLDQYAESNTDSTTTSATFQDKTTLTFTPATAGYYVIIAMAEHNVNSTTNAAELALDVNGTDYYVQSQVQQDSTNYRTWTAIKIENFAASSQTIKIQYRSLAGSTVTIRRARIVALRVTAFNAINNAEQLTRQTTTNSGMDWGSQLALQFTPNNSETIVFCAANVDYAGSTTEGFNILDGIGPLTEVNFQTPHSSGGTFVAQVGLNGRATYGAGQRNAKIQMAQSSLTGSADTVGLDQMAVCFLEVGSRQTYTNNNLSSANTTSSTYQDFCTLTFTPDSSSTYLFLAYTLINNSTTTAAATKLRLQDSTGSTTLCETLCAMKATTDRMCFVMGAIYTSGGSPSSTSFKTQYAAGTGTTTAYASGVTAIKLGSNDQSNSSTAESTTTSTTQQDKVTITFTPGSTGDYLLIMGCDVGHTSSTSSNGVNTVIDVDGTDYCLTQTAVDGANDYKSVMQFVKVNLNSTSHTLKLQYANAAASGTAKIRNAYLIALRLSDWNNSYYSEQRTRQTGGAAKDFRWIDALVATHTLSSSGDHIFLGIGNMDYSTVSRQGWGRVVDNEILTETQTNEEPADTANEMPFFTFQRITALNEVNNFSFNQTSDTTSTNTSGADDIEIVVLQTGV